jgi:hypothetical protein
VAFAIILLLAVVGCLGPGISVAPADPKPARVTEQSASERVELRVGASAPVSGTRTTITFERVRDDSRCPTGVTCIWEGDAIVVLSLHTGTNERATVEVHQNPRFPRQATAQGVTVALEALEPYPEADKPVPAGAYMVKLRVTAP